MTDPTDTSMWIPSLDVYLNHWFTRYEDARAMLERVGGYLLPYKSHFYVTVAGAIETLGMDPEDPDWARIGFDWVQPTDRDAWARLRVRREAAINALIA